METGRGGEEHNKKRIIEELQRKIDCQKLV